jgi:hypothetical protein
MKNPMPTSIIVPRWSLEDLLPDGVGQLEKVLDQIEACVQKRRISSIYCMPLRLCMRSPQL